MICILRALLPLILIAAASSYSRTEAEPQDSPACILIIDAKAGTTIRRNGACDTRLGPASTFKIPLAVMGYDAGVLKTAHDPVWPWRPGIDAPKRDRKLVDPTIWERDSVLWYSREITRHLGAERFAAYVAKFGYGNADVSGDAGKNNGLTHAWLSSSLAISADEQAAFIRQLLSDSLPATKQAQAQARAIIPVFDAPGGWRVHGKTGSIWLRKKDGSFDKDHPLGWFVGWAEKGDRQIIFASLDVGEEQTSKPKGWVVRDTFLKGLARLMRP